MILYPAIDMLDGQAVRLRQGKRDDVTVFGNPVELAQMWRTKGAEWLHLVDLTAAFEGKTAHLPLIREVVAAFDGRVELGGGLRTMEDIALRVEAGVSLIAQMLDEVYTDELKTPVLLETMAGKGSEVGGRFEELRAIMDSSRAGERLGVCMDTCHVFDGGYDIVSRLDDVLEEFDRVIGLSRLKAIHMNDSKNPMGSRKDRHEKIGQGHIGFEAMVRIINHPVLCRLPFYLETPNELDGYAQEIALLRAAYKEA